MATRGNVKQAGVEFLVKGVEDVLSGFGKVNQAMEDFNANVAKGASITLDTAKLTAEAEKLKSIFDVPGLIKFPAPELNTAQWNRVADILKDTSTEAVDFQEKFTQAVRVARAEASSMGDVAAITAEQIGRLSSALLGLGTASGTMLVGFGMVASRVEELNSILGVTTENAAQLATEEAILAEQMGDVTAQEHALATAAALTGDEVQKEVEAVRALHLSGIVANEAVAQMIRYDLDWTRASELAREAQDAATYAMQDSSVAMNGLIQGIITLQPRLLRTYGIMINLDIAYEKWAVANNKSVKEMSVAERQQAALNEVLAKAPSIAGAYEASMGTASKQVRSLKTDTTDFAEAMGQSLTPVLDTAVGGFRDVLHAVVELPAPIRDTVVQMGAAGSAIAILAGGIMKLTPILAGLSAATLGWGVALAAVGAGIGYLVYLNKLDEAHRAEAASVAASSTTYIEYKQRLEWAELASYDLTEQLWKQVEAQEAVNRESMAQNLLDAQKNLEGLADVYSKFIKTGGFGGIPQETIDSYNALIENADLAGIALTEFDRIVLQDTQRAYEWGRALGVPEEKLTGWVAKLQISLNTLQEHDEAMAIGGNRIEKFGDQADGASMPVSVLGDYLEALAAKAGLSVEEVTYLKNVLSLTDDEVVSIGESLNLTNKELVDLAIQAGVAATELLYMRDALGYSEAQIRSMIGAYDQWQAAEEKRSESLKDLDYDYAKKKQDIWADMADELADIDNELAKLHGDNLNEMSDLDREYADKREDAYRDMVQSLADADRELAQDIEDAQRKLQQDLEDANRDYQRDLEDAARDRIQDIEDAEREAAEDRKDALDDLNKDLIDIDEEHTENLKDIEQKRLDLYEEYAEKKLELEKDFAEQAIEIAKKYSVAEYEKEQAAEAMETRRKALLDEIALLKKGQSVNHQSGSYAIYVREQELEKLKAIELAELEDRKKEALAELEDWLKAEEKVRQQAYLEAVAEEERRYQEERAKRLAEYEEKLKELQEDLEREKEEIERDYQRKLEDLRIQHEREREEAQRHYQQKLEDLKIQHEQERAEIERRYREKLEELTVQLEKERAETITKLEEQRKAVREKYAEQAADLSKWYADRKEEINREYAEQRVKILEQIQKTNRDASDEFAKLPASLIPTYETLKKDAETYMVGWTNAIINAINAVKAALQIGSPSKVMIDMGKDVMEGFVMGLGSVDIGKELNSIMGKEAMSLNVQAAMNNAIGTTSMPAGATTIANRTSNQTMNVTANYQRYQSESSLRNDLALYNMMLRAGQQ